LKKLFVILSSLLFVALAGARELKVSMALPLNASAQVNDNYVDFYCGSLLAIRELGEEGLDIKLNVFDSYDYLKKLDSIAIASSDVVIGPVLVSHIKTASQICPNNSYLISPLDPKVCALTDSLNIIQVPSDWKIQAMELVKWLEESIKQGDKVLFLKDEQMDEYGTFLLACLKKRGISFTTIHYKEDPSTIELLESHATAEGTNHIITSCETESYLSSVIRNTNLMNFHQFPTVTYCPAKIRNYASIDVESIHNSSVRLTSAFYVDYQDTETIKFVKAYRALYGVEPNSFAFHGYDLTKYFLRANAFFGSMWTYYLPLYKRTGLQTKFEFTKKAGCRGFYNTAAKRISFNPDYSVNIQ